MHKGRVLLAMEGYDPPRWQMLVGAAGREATMEPAGPADPSITYAIVWKQRPDVLAKLPNLRVIFSVGAGVDHIFAERGVPDVPIVRVVDKNLTQYMTEYMVWRVLDHHRQGMLYREQQTRKVWHEPPQRPASEVAVGLMGLGQLGSSAARALLALGYRVNGWSRRGQPIEGVNVFQGDAGLTPFLNATDILVVILPLTPATAGIIDHALLSKLRRDNNPVGGPVLINAGRGKLQREADILRALEDGTLKEASLDVFETEPLPANSALWTHPHVFVTPHAAATSDAGDLVPPMLAQMDAFERGEPLKNVVDRANQY